MKVVHKQDLKAKTGSVCVGLESKEQSNICKQVHFGSAASQEQERNPYLQRGSRLTVALAKTSGEVRVYLARG